MARALLLPHPTMPAHLSLPPGFCLQKVGENFAAEWPGLVSLDFNCTHQAPSWQVMGALGLLQNLRATRQARDLLGFLPMSSGRKPPTASERSFSSEMRFSKQKQPGFTPWLEVKSEQCWSGTRPVACAFSMLPRSLLPGARSPCLSLCLYSEFGSPPPPPNYTIAGFAKSPQRSGGRVWSLGQRASACEKESIHYGRGDRRLKHSTQLSPCEDRVRLFIQLCAVIPSSCCR